MGTISKFMGKGGWYSWVPPTWLANFLAKEHWASGKREALERFGK